MLFNEKKRNLLWCQKEKATCLLTLKFLLDDCHRSRLERPEAWDLVFFQLYMLEKKRGSQLPCAARPSLYYSPELDIVLWRTSLYFVIKITEIHRRDEMFQWGGWDPPLSGSLEYSDLKVCFFPPLRRTLGWRTFSCSESRHIEPETKTYFNFKTSTQHKMTFRSESFICWKTFNF